MKKEFMSEQQLYEFRRDKKLEKLCRYFRGVKVELPVVEKKVSNKIKINPNYEEDRLGFSGSVIEGDKV